jgi:hypothetical protein
MCLEDYQIGRLIRSVCKVVTVTTGDTELVKPDKDRVAITFSVTTPANTFVTPRDLLGKNNGFVIADLSSLIPAVGGGQVNIERFAHFRIVEYGDLVTKGWLGTSDAEEIDFVIVEYILPEEVLHLTPEQLRQRA